jgi:hypothetical protein
MIPEQLTLRKTNDVKKFNKGLAQIVLIACAKNNQIFHMKCADVSFIYAFQVQSLISTIPILVDCKFIVS